MTRKATRKAGGNPGAATEPFVATELSKDAPKSFRSALSRARFNKSIGKSCRQGVRD